MHSFETFGLLIYNIYSTFWQDFMVLGSCFQNLWLLLDGTLQKVLVKTFKNGRCYQIKSFSSLQLHFWYNSRNDSRNISKESNLKKSLTPTKKKSTDFTDFWPKMKLSKLETFWHSKYTYVALWQNFMVALDTCAKHLWPFWVDILTKNQNFRPNPLKLNVL